MLFFEWRKLVDKDRHRLYRHSQLFQNFEKKSDLFYRQTLSDFTRRSTFLWVEKIISLSTNSLKINMNKMISASKGGDTAIFGDKEASEENYQK